MPSPLPKQETNADQEESRTLRRIAPLLPYVALGIGLGIFRDAWIALGLYHVGALPFLFRLRRPLIWLGPSWNVTPRWLTSPQRLDHGASRSRDGRRRLLTWRIGLVLVLALLGASGLGLEATLWNQLELGSKVPAQLERYGLTGNRWPVFVAYHVLVNPWIEEMLWRGRLGKRSAWPIASDFFFAGYHGLSLWGAAPWTGIAVGIALLTASAWFWRQTAERCGLLLAVLSHAVGDLTVLVGAALLSR